VAEDTQAEIASDLGVSRSLVTQVVNDEGVKDVTRNELSTEEKRAEVREYVEDSPTASNREDTEVAAKLGVSRELVNKVVNSGNDTIIYHGRVKARPPG